MMKVRKHPIDLDKKRYLVYNLGAIYELEQIYGSFDGFFDVIKDMKDEDLFNFIWVGLLHEEEMTVLDPAIVDHYSNSEPAIQWGIKVTVLKAFLSVWTGLKKEETSQKSEQASADQQHMRWNWVYFYHIGTALLNMSEGDFWRCTPVKLLLLWEEYRRFNGLDKSAEEQFQQHEAIINQYI
ncbi:hypothetical protein ACWGNU_14675 [Paenibacillus lautus]